MTDEVDSTEEEVLSNPAVQEVKHLAEKIIVMEDQIAKVEEDLKARKDELRALTDGALPEAMMEVGIAEFKTEDGVKLSLTTFYNAKIPDVKKESAFAWLAANGHDGIIKSKIACTFGRGDEETRMEEEVAHVLDAKGVVYDRKRSVHPSTLKAFVKEQKESGVEFPDSLFGVYVGKRVKVKR